MKSSGLENIKRNMVGAVKWMVDGLDRNHIDMNGELLIIDIEWLIERAEVAEQLEKELGK